MIPAVTLNQCALMYQNLPTYPISFAFDPLRQFVVHFVFLDWIHPKWKGDFFNLKFLLKSAYFDHFFDRICSRTQKCTVVIQDPCCRFEPLCAHVPRFTNISHFVRFRSLSATCDSFCVFVDWIHQKWKGDLLLSSSYLKVLIWIIFWQDLSKDPNMYNSYTGSCGHFEPLCAHVPKIY